MTYPKQNLEERFHRSYSAVPECGCWIWIGPGNKKGHLKIWNSGKPYYKSSTRLSYELHKGVIPEDILVLHTCDVECCVNPEHLYLGTASDNQRDRFNRSKRFKRDSLGRFTS